MAVPAVDIQGVTHRYGSHTALQDINLQVQDGEIYGLLGPNGSGKTTLFRILCTLMAPTIGESRVFGLSTETSPSDVRQRLGVVFQEVALDDRLTVRENLRLQGALYGLHGKNLQDRVQELSERLDVADRLEDAVDELSGGLQRRVDLARGLLHRPDLLLLDEPTAGLDPAARRAFWRAVGRMRDVEGTTLLLTTHLMGEAERCNRIGILSEGALVADGAPEVLKSNLGAETLWLETEAPADLRDRIDAQFGVSTRIIGDMVQVSPPDPPAFLSALYEALGERIRSATIRTPTLEDVFMVHAGVSLESEREEALSHTTETEDRA